MAFEVEQIGDCTLYRGDCCEVLPTLAPVDAVVTDPPYGLNEAAGKNKSRGNLAAAKDYGDDGWDSEPPKPWVIEMIRDKSRFQMFFGGNYFMLPPSQCWLVWDKKNGSNDFADCELVWTNLQKAVRRIEWQWNGMLRKGNDVRVHPTQKPIGVMEWCLGHLPEDAISVLDPYMGSGTTGVACVKRGLKFIGIERERKYFDAACERISQASGDAGPLFSDPQTKANFDAA